LRSRFEEPLLQSGIAEESVTFSLWKIAISMMLERYPESQRKSEKLLRYPFGDAR
jgi:hypothetical protein